MALSRPLGDPLVELVATRLRVLGQPMRVRIIDRLDRVGEARVQALADELEATQQNASKHLSTLLRAGVVARRQEGRVTVYSLTDRETFALIERVGIGLAVQLSELPSLTQPSASHKGVPS